LARQNFPIHLSRDTYLSKNTRLTTHSFFNSINCHAQTLVSTWKFCRENFTTYDVIISITCQIWIFNQSRIKTLLKVTITYYYIDKSSLAAINALFLFCYFITLSNNTRTNWGAHNVFRVYLGKIFEVIFWQVYKLFTLCISGNEHEKNVSIKLRGLGILPPKKTK
jgi:hypothetical protein